MADLTQATSRRASAHIAAGATVGSSLLAPGSRVAGTVSGSVVGRGAIVDAGAVVRDSVLLPGSVVKRDGGTVERAILDDAVEVCGGASVGERGGDIALVGQRAVVTKGMRLAGGARFPEDD